MLASNVIQVALRVATVFERLGIDYLVGGSVASSLHGIPRSTQDVDLVARITLSHVDDFATDLAPDFYVDAEMIREAIRQRGSFNVIHLATLFKVDVFVYTPDELSSEEMDRRQTFRLHEHEGASIVVASPEDIVLQKLHWFQLGGRVSERQWLDSLGVLKAGGTALDVSYMRVTAAKAGLEDVLGEALVAAGISE